MKNKLPIIIIVIAVLLTAVGGIGLYLNKDKEPTNVETTPTTAPTETLIPTEEITPTETVEATPTLIPTPEAVMVEVPNVIGMTKEEAETALKEVSDKFIVNFEEESSSEQEEGLIFAQNATGMVSEEAITLTVSLGVRMVEIPSVYAKKPDVAEQTLQKKGFVTSFEYEYANELKDHVSRTEPAKKELVEYGSKVIIYISKGLEPTPSPTPNPNPSPTPIPVSKLQPNDEVLCSYQIGDNVTGTLYSNMVYVVSGKGATYDFGTNRPQNNRGEMLEYTDKVQKIVVEEGITVIGEWALSNFYDCKEVVLPKSLVEIKQRGFACVGQFGWADITGKRNKNSWCLKINLADSNLVKIENTAFDKTSIYNWTLPETVEYVGGQAFYAAPTNTFTIPASVTYYNDYIFYDKLIIKGKTSIDEFEFFTYVPQEMIDDWKDHFVFEP